LAQGGNPPVICGTNSGYHGKSLNSCITPMFVDVGHGQT
jgi:hypothetical protein